MRFSFSRLSTRRVLPLVLLPILLGGSVAPNNIPSGQAASPTLTVRAVSPAADAVDVAKATTIVVSFDRPVAALSGVGEASTPSPLVSNPPLAGAGRWVTSSLYSWNAVSLRGATVYHLRVPAGLAAIDGTRLQSPYAWSFSTLRPQLLDVLPADGYSFAVPRPTLSLTFNQPMDHASTQTAFRLRDTFGHTLPGAFSWMDNTLSFVPARALVRSAVYTAVLGTGAKSAEGPLPLLAPASWQFSVAPYLRVAGSNVMQGSTAVDLSQSGLDIDFTAPVDERSALGAFQIKPEVPGRYISFGQDDTSLTVSGGFAPSTAYTVTLRAGVRARAGDSLPSTYTLHFVTAPLPPQLLFVAGSVATYDWYRPIVLSLQSLNNPHVDFTISRLDRDGFLLDLAQPYNLATQAPATGTPLFHFTQRVSAPINKPAPVRVQLQLPGSQALPPGYYLVQASGDLNADDAQLLLVTRTSITLKVSQKQVLVWATDLKSGLPVTDLPVQIVTTANNMPPPMYNTRASLASFPVNGSGRTDSHGTLLIAVPSVGVQDTLANDGVVAVADRADDAIAAGASWSNGIAPYYYGLSYVSPQPDRRLNVYTDRPIYRPAQTVHVRGVVRADDDGRYSVVSGPVQLTLTDPTGKVASRKTVLLDTFGAFNAAFSLATDASLGNYGLSVTSGDQTSYVSLQVADYREPTYAVSITTPHSTYAIGQSFPATVAVSYYFGGPVAHAKVHWSVLGYQYTFFSDLFGDYSFGAYDPASFTMDFAQQNLPPGESGYTLFQGDAVTDAHGIVHLTLPAKLAKGQTAQGYSLEADVTDLDNQPVAGRTSVTVYSSAVQLGLQPDAQIIDPKVAQQIHIAAVADDGVTPVANEAIRVAIYRRVYHNVVTTNPDGSPNQQDLPVDTLVTTLHTRTGVHGTAAITFAAPQGGEYHIVASAVDRFGNTAESSVEIYVGGHKPIDWGSQQLQHLRVVPDKKTYHTGDVAHLLVSTPAPNMLALISIERGSILQYQVRRLSGTATVLDVLIPASYLPDTYVSVVVEQGAGAGGPAPMWRLGYADLHVDNAERAITLEITPGMSRATPGQTLPLQVHAADYRGQPVQAQIGISFVDAANLALTGDSGTGSDFLGTFFGPREIGVMTACTLDVNPEQLITQRTISVADNSLRYPLTAGGGSAQGLVGLTTNGSAFSAAEAGPVYFAKGFSPNQPTIAVRQNFQDTAYWNAAVVTDAHGNATLSVPLPDNITTWMILGQAISVNTLVGSGTSSVVATKDLLLRPIAPRFLSLGDYVRIGATINNDTGTAITATLRLSLADGASRQPPTAIGEQTVRLAAGGEQNVTWPVTAGALGTATMLVEAVDVQHPSTNDAVQIALPVQENSTPEEVATSGQAGTHTQELVRIPAGIEPNEGSLSVTLEPTLAAGLRVGADFLAQYPYESSVDLASQIMGYAELGRLPDRAAVLTAGERKTLGEQVAQLLAQLYPMQHGDGGFGWWIEDPYSSPYITVVVADALVTARALGYAVDATVLDNAATYLGNNTQSPAATNAGAGYDANLQAEIVYVLTRDGRGDEVAGLAEDLFVARYLLDNYAQAYLMAALATRDNATDHAHVQTLLADLTSAAKTSGTSVHWDEAGYDWAALDGDIATTAIVLDALDTVQPDSPLVAGAVRWLMAARTANAWESTEATAVSLRGLVDYIFTSGELNANYHYSIQLNGTLWGSGKVDASNLSQDKTLTQPIGAKAPAGSSQKITISREVRPGNGNLNYVIRLLYYRPVDQIAPAAEGVSVTRRYLTADGKSSALGSTIRVQIRVTAPQDLFYLTLEDPLPAGAEAVDSSLQTTSQLAQIQNTSKIPAGTNDLTWYVTHTDLRDNRTVLFLDYLPAGTYQYTYLIHCDTQGVFHMLPTHVQEDYFPEVFGRSNGSYFTVR